MDGHRLRGLGYSAAVTDNVPDSPIRTHLSAGNRPRWRGGAAVAVLALAVGLAGCSGGGGDTAASGSPSASATASTDASAGASPEPAAVDNLDGVKVSGADGEVPTVTFDPFTIAETTSKVLTAGDGPAITEGSSVLLRYIGVNGRTGETFDENYSADAPTLFPLDQVVPGFSKGLVGQKEGSRVLMAITGADGYDSSGGSPQAGIEVGDTLVFVVDVIGAQRSEPSGTKVGQPSGQPTVGGALDDPSISVPSGDAPKKLVVQPLIKGDGPKVTDASTVTVDYRGWLWDGTQVDDTYAGDPQTGPLSSLIDGWKEGLVGQTVGSRVLLVIPADKAYPDGDSTAGIPAGATLVYVVDILQAG